LPEEEIEIPDSLISQINHVDMARIKAAKIKTPIRISPEKLKYSSLEFI
jgi:hypothetical protein